MRFRNPHPSGTLAGGVWEATRSASREWFSFPAGSNKSKLNTLFEALVAGMIEAGVRPHFTEMSSEFQRAFSNVTASTFRKEDDLGGSKYQKSWDPGSGDKTKYHRTDGKTYTEVPPWAIILELTPPYTRAAARLQRRRLTKLHHPDHGGSLSKMQSINAAFDQAMQEIKK